MAEFDSKPGRARAAGGTIGGILAYDAKPAAARLVAEEYAFLGDAALPGSRYNWPEFCREEMATMWTRTWQ